MIDAVVPDANLWERRYIVKVLLALLVTTGVVVGSIGFWSRPVILVNARVLTMDPQDSLVSAMAFYDGRIVGIGDRHTVEQSVRKLRLPWHVRHFSQRHLDLQGKSVLPGFIDAHSHFPSSGIASAGIDVSSPPFGKTTTIAALLETVSERAQTQADERWIIGFNYDDSGLAEKRHPTREELDQAAPDHAVYLRHRSGHMGVANTQALQDLGRYDDSTTGLLQHQSAPGLQRLLSELPWWQLPGIVSRARDEYLRAGVTTVQNGFADYQSLRILTWYARLGLLPQRLLFWPAHDKIDTLKLLTLHDDPNAKELDSGQQLARSIAWPDNSQDATLKIGALKLVADGSPQGRTASLKEPYLADEKLGDAYRGIDYIARSDLSSLIGIYHRAGFQLAIHANGDGAVQSIIDGIRRAQTGFPRTDARHLVVHAQVINKVQLEALAQLDVSLSFFPAHTYYWGDWYRYSVLGEWRARSISPLASADEAGVRYSIHADSPVTPMNPMQMVWSATERLTTSGYLLGAEQRVSRLRALRALTIDAAWQNFLDHDRGSLEPGKLADFVILSADPLAVEDVRHVSVLQVWVGGERQFP